MTETTLVHELNRTIAGGGGSALIYIPKEIKDFVSIGDSIKVDVKIRGKMLILTACKQFFNFDIDDIKQIAKKRGFSIRDQTMADVRILQSTKKKVTMNANINLQEKLAPTYVSISVTMNKLTFGQYQSMMTKANAMKKNFNVITMPEGDIDTVRVMEDPEYYKLDEKKAFDLISKSGRNVGMSITLRFNNKKNNLDEIESVLEQISKFKDQVS